MAALHITMENFETEVLQSDKPVLVDFWAEWCGPCKMLSEEYDGRIKVCKVNVDDQPELAARYRVMTIPTLIVFKDGQVVANSVGVKSKSAILEMLNV